MHATPRPVAESYYRLFSLAHEFLLGVLQGVEPPTGCWEPPGVVPPIQAQVVHVAVSEDVLINRVVRSSTPLCATMFAGRSGWQGSPPITDWDAWARTAQIDLPQVMAYARTVFAATEYWLTQVDDALPARNCDASLFGLGTLPASAVLNLALSNIFLHTGEISCLKGLQGMRGYAEAAQRPLSGATADDEQILSDDDLAALFG